jgi:spore coat protein A, manganese oxidase
MLTRRQLLQSGAVGGMGMLVGRGVVTALAAPVSTLPEFTQTLTFPTMLDRRSGSPLTLFERQGATRVHAALSNTPVWGYTTSVGGAAGMLGPTVEVRRGTPLTVDYQNRLPLDYPSWLPVDRNLTPDNSSRVRTLTHLHGAFVPPASDGNPAVDSGYLNGQVQRVWYPNEQPATLLWYHDHPHGATRLGVAAGLAGLYIVRDQYDTGRAGNANNMPFGPSPFAGMPPYEMPLIIMDRQFDSSGTILYPTMEPGIGSIGMCGNPPSAYGTDAAGQPRTGPWIGEYFGDNFLVNGRVTPRVNVEPRMYRLRIVNGCNGRFVNLKFTVAGSTTAVPFKLIGTDGGMLPSPIPSESLANGQLVMNPADRVDVLIDFRGLAGRQIVMRNQPLPDPYVSPTEVDPPSVMRFDVTNRPSSGPTFADIPANLSVTADPARELGAVAATQRINLDEFNAEGPHWYVTLTNQTTPSSAQGGFNGGSCFDDAVTERVGSFGDTQEWVLFNKTGDTHPIHVHLVQFRILGRQPINPQGEPVGTPVAPAAFERGWKDTIAAHPGMLNRLQARFSRPPSVPGGVLTPGVNTHWDGSTNTFVYHCHILEHEDNDMMRPYTIG